MKNIWSDKPRRTKRGLMGQGHDGLDFPSAEGALMTISFLTFAVFLIKLVLVSKTRNHLRTKFHKCSCISISCFTQTIKPMDRKKINLRHAQQVINTIKSKHYSYNGFDTSQMSSMKIIKKHRNARKLSISDEDDIERVVRATRNQSLAPP